MTTLNPLKAIRKKCIECVGSSDEVEKCTGKMLDGTFCSLHVFRLGKNIPGLSRIKAIRKECLYCMGGSVQLVQKCTSTKCDLHPFRLGTNPNIKPRILSETQKSELRVSIDHARRTKKQISDAAYT